MPCRLLARRRLARAQQHRHRPARCRVVDMDRQEAALPMMSVPEGELLIAVHDVAGVIDIQRHRRRRSGVAGAVDVDHDPQHLCQLARARRILPAAHRRLAGQPRTRSRQLAQRKAEARIIAQSVEIIGILIAAGDREHPRAQDIFKPMNHPSRIARIGNTRRKPLAEPHHALGLSQHQDPAIRGQPAAVKRSCDLLAAHCWKRKYGRAIIASGGCGLWHILPRCRSGLSNHIPTTMQMLTPLPPTRQTTAGE
ncbi:hypothetical protein SAMN04515621_3024 [Erythrobacter sp. HL-111]|nr:hypothetical protein SAMN04515621_3024 [Erythrobacter sp. HL-111]